MEFSFKLFGFALLISFCQGNFLKNFEFEKAAGGAGFSRTPWRSEASGLSALHVFKGDKVNVQLCVPETVTFNITGIRYSNDGPSDNVTIKLDNAHFTTFSTLGNDGDFGKLWNVPISEFKIGEPTLLNKGVHTLEFLIDFTDCYGTELDMLALELNVDVNETDLFCDASLEIAPDSIKTPCAVDWDAPKVTEKPSKPTIPVSTAQSTTISTSTATPTEAVTIITPNSISQLSFNSICTDESNVNIDIHPSSLKNTEIIARSSVFSEGNHSANNMHAGLHCDTDIWRIGEADNSNKELSAVTQKGTVDFDVNIKYNGTKFPDMIDFSATTDVFLNYIIPKKFNIRKGRVRFVLGLTGVTKDVSIGLKYLDRAKKNTPDVEYKTFSPQKQTVEWVIPSRAVSPSLQNVIHIMPDQDQLSQISVDFMKLKFIPRSNTTPMKTLKNSRKWKIRGQAYKVPKRVTALPDGMTVEIDNVPMQSVYSEVDIIKKPNIKVLAIIEGGELFPFHSVKRGRGSNDDRDKKNKDMSKANQRRRQNEEVSGFTFGNTDAQIDKVSISTATSEVLLTYDDGNFVKFTFEYSRTMSKLTVTDTSFTSGPLSFVSTFLTNDLAAVNSISIDSGNSIPIMSPSLNGLTGRKFKFTKTSGSSVFGNNDDLEVVLPK